MNTRTIEARPGQLIDTAIGHAIEQAAEDEAIRFDFSGVDMNVRYDSDPMLLLRDFQRAMSGCHEGAVGPYPTRILSPEVKARDAEIHAENERKAAERQRAYDAQQQAKRETADIEAEGVEIALSDPDAWAECKAVNNDPHGGAAVAFAERWARLMQVRMASGASVADVADSASHDADVEGITGFMYGCAVSILSQVWEHGDDLKRWHNREWGGTGEEEDTLNPAVITIG